MELPALFYGLYRDVKRRTSKIVTQIRKGADWISLVEAEGFLDTGTIPGLIVLDGPSSLLGGEPPSSGSAAMTVMLAFLVMFALVLPVVMAIWFAPPLVVKRDELEWAVGRIQEAFAS